MSVSEAAREGRLRTTEAAILDCCTRWARDYPHELTLLDRQVKMQRETLRKSNGMSAAGTRIPRADIPVTLHRRMRDEIDQEWLWIPELREAFYRVFRVGLITGR